MLVVFCSDPFDRRSPDSAYAREAEGADELGIEYALISFETLVDEHDAAGAVARVPKQDGLRLGMYRGWMLRPEQYRELFEALAQRGVHLLNDPAAYTFCHYLPEWYASLAGQTPESVWLRVDADVPLDHLMELLRPFDARSVVLKDYVKSRKHEWDEACFIPSASDRTAVERVVRRFLELQGSDLNEGLVFRAYEELEPLATHPVSGMPLTVEYRSFVLDGEPIFSTQYWDKATHQGAAPPLDLVRDLAASVRSRFFTADLAKRVSGEWRLIELGDGQVAGLPDWADPRAFYQALLDHWPAGRRI
jgi:hypothetical protein